MWECCQYLIHYLNTKGLDETSDLFHKIKSIDLDLIDKTNLLAYELYEISSNKLFDANEAAEYNNLITNWLNLNNVKVKNENDQIQML